MSRELGRRILLVDDEKEILAVLKDGLQKSGFSVKACRDLPRLLSALPPATTTS